MTDREIMQQALDVMEFIPECGSMIGHVAEMKRVAAVTALRDRLAQPEQEPTGFMDSKLNPIKRQWVGLDALETVYKIIIDWDECGGKRSRRELARRIVDLYTTPPQRQWVGLTEEDKAGFWKADQMTITEWDTLFNEIEEALKEKNT